MLRLDKFLADMQVGTRSEVKQAVRKGRVTVNGEVVKSADIKIDENKDIVCFDHDVVGYAATEYYMLNKPAGCVSATEDSIHETVLDYIVDKKRKDLFPVGRLDIDTEGLLLITNDGALAHELLSPSKHVDKTYFARIDGFVTSEDVELFEHGMDIGEKKLTLPAKLKILEAGAESTVEITICEGKFHQVKRMFEVIQKPVLYLRRIAFGPLQLDESLKTGEYRALTEEEIQQLKNR